MEFNGDAKSKLFYTVLNLCFPKTDLAEMHLFNLEIDCIAASRSIASSTGSDQVLMFCVPFKNDMERPSVRFSFSKYNTKEEIDFVVGKLKGLTMK